MCISPTTFTNSGEFEMFVALFLLFSTLSLSLSICVRDERSPISSCSSIIIVPKSDIVDNSVTLIVELESQFESECQIETTTDAAIEGASLKITQYENYTSVLMQYTILLILLSCINILFIYIYI